MPMMSAARANRQNAGRSARCGSHSSTPNVISGCHTDQSGTRSQGLRMRMILLVITLAPRERQ